MRLAIVLPSLIQTPERARLADLCFKTLAKTNIEGLGSPYLIVLTRPSPIKYDYYKFLRGSAIDFTVMEQPIRLEGTEAPLVYGSDYAEKLGKDYIMWMGEDALFHPHWLWELHELIGRHPEAKAWSVYRSAHEEYHKTLDQDMIYSDAMVSSLCAHGMTFTVAEWKAWKEKFVCIQHIAEFNTTLDLVHPVDRPGERWCTEVSYIEHTGRTGVHTHPEAPEWAVDFQGIEA